MDLLADIDTDAGTPRPVDLEAMQQALEGTEGVGCAISTPDIYR
jgi:hypothetical protein